jgi:putative ABC transport system ATP-binding protein
MNTVVAQFDNVQRVYRKNKAVEPVYALRKADFSIYQGQYVAIMGPSGSGKSTVMNILGCLDRPTAGRYILDGQDVAQLPDEELSRVRGKRLGFIFQAFNLIPQLTVLENVQVPLFYQGIPRRQRNMMAEKAIERVGLGKRGDHRPMQLSGGQQQRVAIARALVCEPSLLLADEPTGNLDSRTGQAILKMFDELHEQGMTLIMVTHDESIATRCERVIRLKDGLIDSDKIVENRIVPEGVSTVETIQ